MAVLRLRYVHDFVDKKTGRPYYYFRYREKRWPLPGQPGTAEFTAAYDALLRQCVRAKRADSNIAFAPATLGHVIERYVASDKFTKRAPATQRVYRPLLDRLKEIAGSGLIADMRERHVRLIRKEFTTASAADNVVMLIRMLWQFAKDKLDMELGANPAAEVKDLHQQTSSYQPWPQETIDAFLARAHPNARYGLMLLLHTGQRVSDVAAMQWHQYDGRWVRVRQIKTGTFLQIPCTAPLREMLDALERKSDFILTTSHGSGYHPNSLGKIVKSGEYTAHGLRANAAVILAEAGCSMHQIAAITGHASVREVLRYTKGAEQKKMALQAIDQAGAAFDKVANLRTKG
jgi:integrase